jgi:ABC-type antimicrobial peptide transport system permease subunit
MVVLSTFAGMALLLACLGIYGVIASLVAGRMHELAIRVALGARSADVLRLVFKDATWMIGPGIVLGLGAALALTRVMANLVYGVSPTDVPTFAAVAVLLAVVALLACYVPARRAVRADPLRALRDE